MLFCGLRKDVTWGGWHRRVPGLEAAGESRTAEALRELILSAQHTAAEAYESITSGRIAPHPADPEKCRWCDYRDICRVESVAATAEAGTA
jgi:hypothetical protein